jgi:plasmid replication initiation protein
MNKALQVRQANAITTARYEYSELQLDVFFFLLSKLKKEKKDTVYELSIKEMSDLTGKQYRYGYLRKATEQMGGRMFEVENEVSYKQMWMFQHIEYIKGAGIIEVKLSESITPYLFDLKDNFTSFELYAALKLGSKYAKRIYTICSQWKDIGETKAMDITDFKHKLGLIDNKGNEQYTKVSMFQKFVLDTAVKQINKHTDLKISYVLEKKGRSFKNIKFIIKAQLGIIPATFSRTEIPKHEGLTESQIASAHSTLERLKITTPKIVSQILEDATLIKKVNQFAYEIQTGKIKATTNPAGLLLTVLGIKTIKQK